MKVFRVKSKNITFRLPDVKSTCRVGYGEDAYTLLEIYAGFDIETTNIYQVEKEFPGWHAYAYHMQLTLYTQKDEYVYLFRSWDVVEWFFDHIIAYYDLSPERHMLIWIANMSFEFQFMRCRFKWDDDKFAFFAKEERQPLLATYRGIEFREALAISGGSLAQLAKDYCRTQKLVTYKPDGTKVSDLDYSIERNSHTKLTPQEEQYCINDVVILAEFSEYMFNNYIRPTHNIPMTKTSILLNRFKTRFKELCKYRDKKYHLLRGTSEAEYRRYILTLFPERDTYSVWMKYLFRGGYVHANAVYSGTEGLKARMRDITSHYPARMNLAYYPSTPFRKVPFNKDLLKTHCCILHVQIDFIQATTSHSIESKNKIVSYQGAKWDNGRLRYADMVELWITELDLAIYDLFYTSNGGRVSDNMTVLECYTAKRGKQPPFVLDILNTLYREKNTLKRTGQGKTQKYQITKAGVNTCYGAEVKRIRLQKVNYDSITNLWKLDTITPDFEKERRKQLLLPQMGIYVTAHARYELLTLLYRLTKAGVIVYYMDTDSIKYAPSHKAEQIFKHYNNSIKRHRHNRRLRNSNFDDLGEFDIELKDPKTGRPAEVDFKMLRAKCYIYHYNGEITATVAGMPKVSINALGKTPEEILNEFSLLGFSLTPDESNKLTTKYRDNYHYAIINGEKMEELSSVALYKIPFKVSIKDDYQQIINELKEEAQYCKL